MRIISEMRGLLLAIRAAQEEIKAELAESRERQIEIVDELRASRERQEKMMELLEGLRDKPAQDRLQEGIDAIMDWPGPMGGNRHDR